MAGELSFYDTNDMTLSAVYMGVGMAQDPGSLREMGETLAGIVDSYDPGRPENSGNFSKAQDLAMGVVTYVTVASAVLGNVPERFAAAGIDFTLLNSPGSLAVQMSGDDGALRYGAKETLADSIRIVSEAITG